MANTHQGVPGGCLLFVLLVARLVGRAAEALRARQGPLASPALPADGQQHAHASVLAAPGAWNAGCVGGQNAGAQSARCARVGDFWSPVPGVGPFTL